MRALICDWCKSVIQAPFRTVSAHHKDYGTIAAAMGQLSLADDQHCCAECWSRIKPQEKEQSE